MKNLIQKWNSINLITVSYTHLGSSSSAEAGILSYRVIIIELSAAVASRMLSCKEIIQVTLMGWLIHARCV